MAANRFASLLHRGTHRMAFLLIYTLLEWILIALLLLNAIFSYLISKFASFFGLSPPCILCARVDHLFEPDNGQNSFGDLLCDSHSGEISKLGFCSKHHRLSKAGGMCEGCAASRPGEADQNISVLSYMKRSGQEEKKLCCSCCGVVFEGGFYSSYSLLKSEPWDIMECALKERTVRGDVEGENDDALCPEVEHGRDILPSAEIKRKKEEGEEGEVPIKAELFLSSPRYSVEDMSLKILNFPLVKMSDDERLIPIELIDFSTVMTSHSRGHDANDILLLSNADEGSANLDVGEIAVEQPAVSSSDKTEKRHINSTLGASVITSEGDSHVSLPTNEPFEDAPIDDHSIMPGEATDTEFVITKNAEAFEAQQGSEEESKGNEEVTCEISIGSDICDQEQVHHAQNNQSDPDLELLPVPETIDRDSVTEAEPKQNTRKVNHLTVSPVIYEVLDEGMPETPSTPYFIEGFPVLPKRFLLERRESGTESLDGSIASDFESIEPLTIDRLKAALKAERKSLTALYTELEEERSASAIAANQTMAMITRLQEEKAAMQMEALQYHRMMEEQSEYDQEALQILNDLMMKREKEKQELERELDLYREKVLMYESMERRKGKVSSSLEDSDDLSFESQEGEESNVSPHMSNKNAASTCFLNYVKDPNTLDGDVTEFEENRVSICEQIKALEEKLFKRDDEDEKIVTESTEHYGIKNGHGMSGASKFLEDGFIDRSSNGFLHNQQTDANVDCAQRNNLLPLFEAVNLENESKLNLKYYSVVGISPDSFKKLDIVEEIDQVYKGVRTLEADSDFMKHCISSSKNGEKWVNLLQEILRSLHDLRRLQHCARSSDV